MKEKENSILIHYFKRKCDFINDPPPPAHDVRVIFTRNLYSYKRRLFWGLKRIAHLVHSLDLAFFKITAGDGRQVIK